MASHPAEVLGLAPISRSGDRTLDAMRSVSLAEWPVTTLFVAPNRKLTRSAFIAEAALAELEGQH